MCEESEESPLVRLGMAIDNGELTGVVRNYKCEKCGRSAKWETYLGIPAKKIPCGSKCGGYLVLQHDEECDVEKSQDDI